MRHPLPLAALLYSSGLVAGFYLPAKLAWMFLLTAILAILTAFIGPWRRVLLLLLLPLVAWTNLLSRTEILSPWDLRQILSGQPEFVTVRGRLLETPSLRVTERASRTFQRSIGELQVEAILRGDNWESAFGRIVLSRRGAPDPKFFRGRRIEATGVLQPPLAPAAPGQFDYRAYLRLRGVYYQMRSEDANDWRLVLTPDVPETAPPWSDRFVVWAQRVLAKGLLVEDQSLRLLWAMVLGWKTALTQEVSEPFMQSGTLHIFAISGMHIALIAGILASLLRVLRVPRSGSGLLIIPIIWFYTGATGWQASAVRSTIMMSIVIAGWAARRPTNLLNSLAAAALIILMGDPLQLFQAGFQLSFFVVLGIALLVPPLERFRERWLHPDPLLPPELRPFWIRMLDRPIRIASTSLATSAAAWLGSMPLIAFYFYMVTPGSLLANLLIVPLSSLALMSSLGSLVCGDWLPFLTELFNHSSWLWMVWMVRLSEWFAELPGSYFYLKPPPLWASMAYYLILGGLLSGILLAPKWRIVGGAAVSLLAAGWVAHAYSHRDEVELTVLPIRAGAIFVDALGKSEDLLVDCGDAVSADSIIKPFLRSQGVNRLRRILLTHGDVAHTGGTQSLATHFRARTVLTNPARSRSRVYRDLVASLEQSPGSWQQVQRGDTVAGWDVLHPSAANRFTQAGDHAVVLRAEIHGTRLLLLSDLGRLGQRTLLENESEMKADILVIGIQSQDGLSQTLVGAIDPKLLIVAGANTAGFGRPNSKLREQLGQLKIPVIFTSNSGATVVTLRPGGWTVQTMIHSATEPATTILDE